MAGWSLLTKQMFKYYIFCNGVQQNALNGNAFDTEDEAEKEAKKTAEYWRDFYNDGAKWTYGVKEIS